jgi:excisionase family DNA binding protein
MSNANTMPKKLIPTSEAARLLGLSVRRVAQLVRSGDLAYQQIGYDFWFAVETIKNYRRKPRGRPRKQPDGK